MSEARTSRNLSIFELGISAAIIFVLFLYGMQKMRELEVFTESTGIETMIRNMRSNVKLWVSAQYISGGYQTFLDMDGKNPISVMFNAPGSYQGEFENIDIKLIPKGSWAFEKTSGNLIYRVINHADFENMSNSNKVIRLRLTMSYRDENNNNQFDDGVDQIVGLSLKNVNEYKWLIN